MHKSIQIQYFALFREQRGTAAEQISTSAPTLRDLYRELKTRHNFSLPEQNVRVAVNDEFRDWDEPLHDSDSIVFIPPVAGG